VEVAVTRADGAVEVTVSDNGQGISPSFLPHVFTPFRQADGSSTRRHGGLGLGLAICRQLVELHGGTITAESEGPGRGATFVVRLPAGTRRSGVAARPDQVRHPPVPTGESAQRAATPGGKTPLAGLSVLLVEDDANTRSALCLILGQAGAAVTSAASATEALDILARSRPDVLVSDIGLPDTDGYALVAEVRRGDDDGQRPRLPAVALTAFARNEDRRRALATGFDDYLSKPVEQEELVSAVARAAGLPGRLT
jgi:CheY-like chemotaxis protein